MGPSLHWFPEAKTRDNFVYAILYFYNFVTFY